MKKAYVIVDMQNDFVNGSLGTPEAQAAVPKIVEKLRQASPDDLIILTQDTHHENYLETDEGKKLPVPHCIFPNSGWEIVDEIKEVAEKLNHEYIHKSNFGSYSLPTILAEHEITHAEFCGVCTDICVISNVLVTRTLTPDIRISVDSECCAGVSPELHTAAINVMKSCQIDMV